MRKPYKQNRLATLTDKPHTDLLSRFVKTCCLVILAGLACACDGKNNQFHVYDIDPYQEGFRKNKIHHYIKYTVIRDTVVKLDSVTLSESGKVLSTVALLGWEKEHRTYDSADRLTGIECESDVYQKIKVNYIPYPDKKMVEEIWTQIDRGGNNKGSQITRIRYNDQLNKILNKSRHTINGDSIVTEFLYTNGRLTKTLTYFEDKTDTISYTYNRNGELIQVRNSYSSDRFYILDFISPVNGLRDSTFHKRGDLEDMVYYEYFSVTD